MKTSQAKYRMLMVIVGVMLMSGLTVRAFGAEQAPQLQTTATPKSEKPLSHRSEHRWGGYLGFLGDPAPTIVGINAAYNINDFLRAHAGYGHFSVGAAVTTGDGSTVESSDVSMTTLGAGINAMVPGWSLTPVLGLSYSHVSASGEGLSSIPANNVYGTLGLDWQSEGGFNIGLGVNEGVTSGSMSGGYLNLGWFI